MILDFLKTHAMGERNAVKGYVLSALFDMTPLQVRKEIKRLRMSQELIIGANNRGYFIPNENEHLSAVRYSENKVISQLETTIKQRPAFILEVYKRLNELKKGLPEAVHNAIRFNEDEDFEIVDLYNEKLPFE